MSFLRKGVNYMSYSRRARIDNVMSREAQQDLAMTNADAGISIAAIAEMMDLSPESTKEFISEARIRQAKQIAASARAGQTESSEHKVISIQKRKQA